MLRGYHPRTRRIISRRPASPRKVAIAISPPPLEFELPPLALPLMSVEPLALPLADVSLAPLPLAVLPDPLLPLAPPIVLPAEPWFWSLEVLELLELDPIEPVEEDEP